MNVRISRILSLIEPVGEDTLEATCTYNNVLLLDKIQL